MVSDQKLFTELRRNCIQAHWMSTQSHHTPINEQIREDKRKSNFKQQNCSRVFPYNKISTKKMEWEGNQCYHSPTEKSINPEFEWRCKKWDGVGRSRLLFSIHNYCLLTPHKQFSFFRHTNWTTGGHLLVAPLTSDLLPSFSLSFSHHFLEWRYGSPQGKEAVNLTPEEEVSWGIFRPRARLSLQMHVQKRPYFS